MKKTLFALIGLICTIGAYADDTKSQYDLDAPFGFCTVTSRTTSGTSYNITGGGCYQYPVTGVDESQVTTLTSTGGDMRSTITNAINNYDVIVLDGSKGDFIISKSIDVEGKSGKTILGINNARLCTQWYLTDEIIAALDEAGVKSMSTSSKVTGSLYDGGSSQTLEQAEFYTRKTIIAKTGDTSENYRKAGIFTISKNSANIIIRNITFVGPGSVDVGGYDLISIVGANHIWVDHCAFKDGEDGNFDITNSADFNTVSWCTFSYTSRSYMHQNTNLVGSSDSEATGYLNTTYAFNWWGKGCVQRMPMARAGKIHMLNNYFTSTSASNCINPRANSEFLIEGNYFGPGVSHYYSQSGATAVTWTTNNYIAASSTLPSNTGSYTVTVPYTYTAQEYSIVPTDVKQFAGPTLFPEYNDGPSGTTGTITWPLNNSTTAVVASSVSDGIASTSVTLGSGVHTSGSATISGSTFTKYQPDTENETAATANNSIVFSFSVKDGYKFHATGIKLLASNIGNTKGKIDATWNDSNGKVSVLTGAVPAKNSDGGYTEYDENISDNTEEVTGDCSLSIGIYNLATGSNGSIKEIGLANIIIEGTLISPTGISTPVTFSLPVSIEYYTISGQKVDSYAKGIIIEKQRMQDGKVKTYKKVRR